MAIVYSVLLQLMPSDYPLVICWPLYRLSFDLRLLITPLLYVGNCIVSYFDLCLLIITLVSVGNCIVCATLIYAFWLPLWYLLATVSSVLLWCMPSDYPFVIFWPVYRLSYFDLCLLIAPLVSFGHCIGCPSIYGFWLPLCYRLAIVSSPTSIYAFWLPHWYLLAIVSSVLLWFMPSDYPFGIFWPLYRLSYFDLYLLITPLVSFGHCIVCPTLIYAFWLPLCYLLASVSSVLLWFMPSDYPFVFFWPVYRLSYFD